MNEVAQLMHLAYQYGPFAFSMIFLFMISRWGQKRYQETCTRQNPASSEQEKNTYRFHFVAVTVAGILLVGASVYWWWNHQPVYLHEGEVVRLSEHETLEGSEFYIRNDYYKTDGSDGAPQLRDVHYVIVQHEPFMDGQEIELRYFRDRSYSKPLKLKIQTGKRGRHVLEYDQKQQKWIMQQAEAGSGTIFAFISAAFAQAASRPIFVPQAPPPVVIPQSPAWLPSPAIPPPVPSPTPAAVPTPKAAPAIPTGGSPGALHSYAELEALGRELQDSKTLVSRKVQILDRLLLATTSDLDALLASRKFSELLFLTIMDHARHTDREAASKSALILSKVPLPTRYFADLLRSNNDGSRNEAVSNYLRLEPAYANKLVGELDKQGVNTTILKTATKAGMKPVLLVPTATAGGDKYYVKAEWNQSNGVVVQCLAKLFNARVTTGRTLSDNIELMKSSSVRYAFDSDKVWTKQFAGDIEKCGGKASFVGYFATVK